MHSARHIFIVALLSLSTASLANAQLPQTRIFAIFPPGAQAGQSLEVSVTNGADLEELDQMLFSHPGIKSALKSGNTFTVTVEAGVPSGVYDCRVHGLYGTSNPRAFVVGDLPEIQENDAPNTKDGALEVKLGSVINGRTNAAADVDYFKFTGTKGQRVLLECTALRIDSRFQGDISVYTASGRRLGRSLARLRRFDPLLDVTLPEDGEYLIRVTDFVFAGSNDYCYRLKVHTGPYIDFVAPAVGVAGSTAKYTIYGRNLPGGLPAEIAADGQQLQKLDVQISLPDSVGKLETGMPVFAGESGRDGAAYSFTGANGTSTAVTIALAPRAAILEAEPNNAPNQSQKLVIPAEVTGQFQTRGDLDCYDFEAKAGTVYWIEVFGERLGQESDPYFKLEQVTKMEDGTETVKILTTLDDDPTNAIPNLYDTVNNDVTFRFVTPADGSYRITLRDRYFEARGAPNLQYHLAVREEAPDFRIAVVSPAPLQNAAAGYQTWALGLRRGENLQIQVAAIRQHGFTGAIDLSVTGLPEGVVCKGAVIAENTNFVDMIFSAAENAQPISQPIQISGKARLEDPAKVAAVVDAEAALKKAADAIPGLVTAVEATVKPMVDAEAARKTAQAKADTDAEALKKAQEVKTAADVKVAAAQTAEKAATDEHAKATADLAAAKTAAQTAAAELAAAKAALDKDKENQVLKDAVAAAEKKNADADAVVKTTTDAVTVALTKLNDAKKATQTAVTEQATAATAVTAATTVNTASAKVLATAVDAHNAAIAKNKQATDAKVAGDAAVATSTKTLTEATAARNAAAKDVSRSARTATVVWNGTAQQPAVTRVTRNLVVSVMDEDAPYQLNSEVVRVAISQNQQVIVPLQLAKRVGFNNKITLNPVNLPKNVAFEKAGDIEVGKNEVLARFNFPANVAEGTYTVFIQAQGQVAYQRSLKALAKSKTEQEEADKAQKLAAELAKTANDEATKAATELTTAGTILKTAQTEQATSKKNLTDAQTAEQIVVVAKAAADQALTDAQAKATATQVALDAANKALETDKENADLKKAVADATIAKAAADTEVTTAQTAATAAAENLTKAQAVTKAATDDLATKDKGVETAQANVKTTTDAKAVADAAKKTADDALKAANDRKANADKAFTAATNVSKANNLNWFPPSTPVVVSVNKGGYFTLTGAVPDSGNLKQGQKLEIKVTLKRASGFAGPVTVSLDLSPAAKGVAAAPITIPADQTEGTLVVTAAADATEGAIQYLALRGTADWNGSKVGADQPIAVKVVK